MCDQATWQDIWLFGLGSALLAGVLAAGVARLTVHWTQRGDKEAAKLVESQKAAETLTAAVWTAAATVARWKPSSRQGSLGDWRRLLDVELPIVTDPELVERVRRLGKEWTLFGRWVKRPDGEDRRLSVAERKAQRAQAEAVLDEYHSYLAALARWVSASLAAHRRGEDLPVDDEVPERPAFAPDIDSAPAKVTGAP